MYGSWGKNETKKKIDRKRRKMRKRMKLRIEEKNGKLLKKSKKSKLVRRNSG